MPRMHCSLSKGMYCMVEKFKKMLFFMLPTFLVCSTINNELKSGGIEVKYLINEEQMSTIPIMTKPGTNARGVQETTYITEMKLALKKKACEFGFTAIWRQCTNHMKQNYSTSPTGIPSNMTGIL